MGVYIVPELIEMGYQIDVIALGDIQPDSRQLCYIKENGKDINVLKKNSKGL